MSVIQGQMAGETALSTLGWLPASTRQVESFKEWKDFVRDNFPWLEFRNRASGQFDAEIYSQQVGCSGLSMIRTSAGEVKRTRHLAEMTDSGSIKIMWQLSGGLMVEQDDRSCSLSPGQATVCDSARPYRIQMSDQSKFAVLMLPHDYCAGWEHISESICATTLYKGASMRSVLGTLMALTAADRDEGEEDIGAVLDAIQLMVTKLLYRSAEQTGLQAYNDPRLNKARDHIIRNLSDSSFGPDDLASAMCMSRRSLYMLFEEIDTTPVKLIRELRLETAVRALLDSREKNRKITDIAFDSGFSEYATFTRLFKTRYGKTPREFREDSSK